MTPTLLRDEQLPTARPEETGSTRTSARQPESTAACAACPHPMDGHDAIALRFCRATCAGRFDRGCVCRSA